MGALPNQTDSEQAEHIFKCGRCGAQLKLVNAMLDPVKGRVVHMFKCQCGERTWAYDQK
jgi:hypothetical protein